MSVPHLSQKDQCGTGEEVQPSRAVAQIPSGYLRHVRVSLHRRFASPLHLVIVPTTR